MKGRLNVPLRVAAVTASAALVTMTVGAPALAAEGDVQVVNTETVQVYTDATGAVETKRIYEQVAFTGNGEVELRNPIATDGLRNLDSFGGFAVEDGEQVASVSVDGDQRLRTVSDFDGDLPLDVQVRYFLDGEPIEPADVVGQDGELEVRYTVKNVTAAPQELTFDDGNGGTVTRTVDVPIPMVGSLTLTAPSNFTDVRSDQANLAGDGKGGTKLSFTMTLFPPIGSDTAEFGYTANISDGVIPRAAITVLPVNPLESPSFASAGESYKGGADTGIELAAGASEIDANLLKLRDGAGELLAGLIQLRDGAVQLNAGLAGEAAPGASRLASGASELAGGIGQLDAGAQRIADGSARLATGSGDALAGSSQLTDGLARISGGLAQLADPTSGLPAAGSGAAELKAGVDLLISKLGSVEDPATLIGGLARLEAGLGQLEAGAGQLEGGLQQLAGGLPTAKGGVDQVKTGIDAALATGGSLDQLVGGLTQLKALCLPDPRCVGTIDALILGVTGPGGTKESLGAASAGLGQVSSGLGDAVVGLETQILPGAAQLEGGIGEAKAGAGALKVGSLEFRAGMSRVGQGMTELADGVTAAVAGVLQLSDGAASAYVGSGELTTGLGRLQAGADELSQGAGEFSAGSSRAADGANQVADGANQLASGLGDAADGSGRLADGLSTAADSAPQIVDGAGRLSEEGTSKLVEAGESTAQNYGEMYATIEAGAERAQTEKMVFGAPEGAMGLAAYSYEIKGEDGEGSRNVARGLGGLAVLAAGAAAFAMRRKLI